MPQTFDCVSESGGRISGLDPRDCLAQTGLNAADSIGPPAKMRPEHAKAPRGMQYWKGAELLENLPRRAAATLTITPYDVPQRNSFDDVGADDGCADAQ